MVISRLENRQSVFPESGDRLLIARSARLGEMRNAVRNAVTGYSFEVAAQ